MQCRRLQLKLLQKGKSSLDHRQLEHLRNCSECREFADTVHRLETCGSEIDYGEPGGRLDSAVEYRVHQLSSENLVPAAEEQARSRLMPLAAMGAVLVLCSIFLWHLTDMRLLSPDSPTANNMEERTEEAFPQGVITDEVMAERYLQSPPLDNLEEQLWLLEAEMATVSLDLEEDYQIWYAEAE